MFFFITVTPVVLKSVSPKTFCERLHWLPMVDGKLPPDAMIGGFENEHIYIARAYHNYSLCIGKYVKSAGKAFVPWRGREHCKEDFEILCGFNAKWIKTKSHNANKHAKLEHQVLVGGPKHWVYTNDSNVPHGAFPGGHTEDGETLYVGRVNHEGGITNGYVQRSRGCCYIPISGQSSASPITKSSCH